MPEEKEKVLLFLAGHRIDVLSMDGMPDTLNKEWSAHRERIAFFDKEIPEIAKQIRGC